MRWRAWLDLLVVTVFALGVPFFAAAASLQGNDKARAAGAMSCHDEPGRNDPASPTDSSKASLAHLCCFTVCIPLATPAGSVVSLAMPVSEPLVVLLPRRLSPRVIGVDPPPPKA